MINYANYGFKSPVKDGFTVGIPFKKLPKSRRDGFKMSKQDKFVPTGLEKSFVSLFLP
jgi:hypothetical protein